MKANTYALQFLICFVIIALSVIGIHQDIFNLTEGVLAFTLGMVGFVHAGIKLVLID